MRNKILQWVPLTVLLIAWEAYAKFQSGFSTMFSSPVRIITLLYEKTVSGDLPYHTFITAYESFVGLLFGLFIGCIIGFILVFFPKCSKIAHPYIIALSSIPTFYYCFSNLWRSKQNLWKWRYFFQNQSCYQQTTLLDALIPSLTGLGYPITQTECRLLCFGSIHWRIYSLWSWFRIYHSKSKWLIRYHLCLCRYYMYYLTFYVF